MKDKAKDGRLDLIERLIANTRLTCRHADPATLTFCAGVLEDLERRKSELLQSAGEQRAAA
jgi:hypothetical protein